MRIDGPAFVKVEEASIRYFDLGLIDNVLTRPAYQLEGFVAPRGRKTDKIPNSSFSITLGTLSTTCSFPIGGTGKTSVLSILNRSPILNAAVLGT